MRLFGVFGALCLIGTGVSGQDSAGDVWQLESKGEAGQGRERLKNAAEASPNNAAALRAYAEFLDQHRDPAAREAYGKLARALAGASPTERVQVTRRLTLLDLVAGDRASAERHLQEYRAAGGAGLSLPQSAVVETAHTGMIDVPGPLRSFARMAALSPDLQPEDLLSALARNVVTNGYQTSGNNESLDQTEYLKLVVRYLAQARELEKLGGEKKTIQIKACESTETGDLLRVIGYRMRGGCGSDVVLETVNASRAFLTIDSGFPVAELEEALRTNRPFTLDYRPTKIPVLYGASYWQSAKPNEAFIDAFIGDPSLCRLYLGLSKLDPETAQILHEAVPAARLKIYAHVLDFFGAMFEIRGGKAVVPGGARSEKAWNELTGADVDKGAAFFEKLLAREDGWLCSYFDALARINGPLKDYLTEPERLKRFYSAIRGRVTSPGPARPVFRANTDMLLLTTRLRLDANGKPHLPGGIDVWKNLFVNHPQGRYDAKLTKAANSWKDPDDVLEALFGLSRKAVENEPLKIFMALSDVERNRAKPLETATIDRLSRDFRLLGAQYALFSEVPAISDKTIVAFLDGAHATGQIRDPGMRADAAGTLQALAGLWLILARQGEIKPADSDVALAEIVTPFLKIQNERELFDAGRNGVNALFKASHSPDKASAQDHMVDLLAGAGADLDTDTRQRMIENMIRVFEAQRLISLTSLFDLADHLDAAGHGQKLDVAATAKLATRISEVELPRNGLAGAERTSLAFGYWSDRHVDAQRKMNLRPAIEKAAADPAKLAEMRGLLAPLLRDTLVGFNYIHYAPPGAQVLFTNPLFVRSHDFIGIPSVNQTWKGTDVFGTGWPANAGGRLVGSLASLPYALAEAEQNFLIPSREQALIWGDLVPQMILSAVVPRWWNVTPVQLHWVGIHMAYGETLLAESALDPERRKQVLAVIGRYAPPVRLKKVERLLAAGDVPGASENVVPSELYVLATEFSAGDRDASLVREINRVAAQSPDAVSAATISRAFGTPKPTLTNSYQTELLNLRTFPTLMGYSSRIMAESWESSLLFYAALADEMHIRPSELNLLVPQWTAQTVERIFATHLEDWPALLRSLRLVGDDVRQKARKQLLASADK